MKKIEKEIKKYYLKALEHDDQLEVIKKRTDFFSRPVDNRKSFFSSKLGLSLSAISSIGFAALIIGVVLSINSNSSSQSEMIVSPITNRLKNSIVQIDSNPSIVFTLDEEGIVNSVHGQNYDGKMIIYNEKLIGESYESALKTIIDREIKFGYLYKDSKEYNNLKFTIYSDSNISEEFSKEDFNQSINNYLEGNNVYLASDLIVNYKSDYSNLFSSIYSYEEYQLDTYEDFYNFLQNYYVENNVFSTEAEEEFYQICFYYSDKLAFYQTALEDIIDSGIKNCFDGLKARINRYLNGYYNGYIYENSSYQKVYSELINNKVELLKNKASNQETSLIEDEINSNLNTLEKWKKFIDGCLKTTLDSLNNDLNRIKVMLSNYDIEEDFVRQKQSFEENKKIIQNEYNAKYKIKSSYIEKMKEELINYFK